MIDDVEGAKEHVEAQATARHASETASEPPQEIPGSAPEDSIAPKENNSSDLEEAERVAGEHQEHREHQEHWEQEHVEGQPTIIQDASEIDSESLPTVYEDGRDEVDR